MAAAPRAAARAGACRDLLLRLRAALAVEGAGVTVLLATDRRMRDLNRRHRGRDGTTDVLSFPSGGSLEPGVDHLGEIAISLSQAGRQARRAGWSLGSELALLLTHGFLHLLGFDHETDDGTMRRLEARLLKRVARVRLEARALPWGEDPIPPIRPRRPATARRTRA